MWQLAGLFPGVEDGRTRVNIAVLDSFEPVEGSLSHLVDYLGAHKILWATDYPHPDGFFPGAPAMIAEKLSEENKRKVLAESAIQFYKLT